MAILFESFFGRSERKVLEEARRARKASEERRAQYLQSLHIVDALYDIQTRGSSDEPRMIVQHHGDGAVHEAGRYYYALSRILNADLYYGTEPTALDELINQHDKLGNDDLIKSSRLYKDLGPYLQIVREAIELQLGDAMAKIGSLMVANRRYHSVLDGNNPTRWRHIVYDQFDINVFFHEVDTNEFIRLQDALNRLSRSTHALARERHGQDDRFALFEDDVDRLRAGFEGDFSRTTVDQIYQKVTGYYAFALR